MSFFSRLFGRKPDLREQLRPLWFRVVEISRLPEYYAKSRVADTVEGRFDMVVTITALTMLRMEKSRALAPRTAALTELFVDDMDGQLRESGVGDVVVGKHMGKLMSALGGRMGALRDAMATDDEDALRHVLERNVNFAQDGNPADLANRLRALYEDLASRTDDQVVAGDIAR